MNKIAIPKLGKSVSRLGFGGHKMTGKHGDCLKKCLLGGVNLLDTSAHFGQGASEAMIGRVLKELMESNQLTRKDVVVTTKAGFVFGNMDYPHMARISPSVGHCISPAFVESQLSSSLDRLGLDNIDILLLNCPEKMLQAKNMSLTMPQVYDLIGESFEYLEKEVARGRISGYGIASNTLSSKSTHHDSISFVELINTIGTPPHLAAIQFPLNVFELGALESSDGEPSLAECIQKLDLFAMTQRPLQAIYKGKVRLLSSFGTKEFDYESLHSSVSSFYERLDSLESTYQSDLVPILYGQGKPDVHFYWSSILAEDIPSFSESFVGARYYIHDRLLPQILADLDIIKSLALTVEKSEQREMIHQWAREYESTIREFLDLILEMTQSVLVEQNRNLNGILSVVSRRSLRSEDSLSYNLLKLYTSLSQGPHSTLVGLNELEFVDDALKILSSPPLDQETVQDIIQMVQETPDI